MVFKKGRNLMANLKIALGDLRHNAAGRHSTLMPVGIGYIASYTLANTEPGSVEIRFYVDPDVLLQDIRAWRPDVVGLSNYSWNTELSCLVFRQAKNIDQRIICIAGGPEFPIEPEECRDYLIKRKEIDFFVYREGEIAFAQLMRKFQENGQS